MTEADRDAAYASIDELADWSEWVPFAEAIRAPRSPGVYMIRAGRDRQVVYVGMAAERSGNGLRGRLAVYRTGKGATSGFGEAVFDRALADPAFLRQRIANVGAGRPETAKEWVKAAIEFAQPEIRWAACATGTEADALERRVGGLLAAHGLWNKAALRSNAEW